MLPSFVGSGPYDRPMQTQATPLPGHSVGLGSPIRQQGQLVPPGMQQQHQSMFLPNAHNQQLPHHQQHQQQQVQMRPPPPPPQINPLGSTFGNGGPVSLHLKRDPGFDHDPMAEGMQDPAKQAYDMSTHFLLPVNTLPFSQFAPGNQPQFGLQPGSSSRSNSCAQGTSYLQQTSSFSSPGPNGAIRADSLGGESTSGVNMLAGFDPMALAQNLSSAYVSAVAGMQPQQGASQLNASTMPTSAPARSSNARGKSASHTPFDSHSEGSGTELSTSSQMNDLRRKIRAIISSVWAGTECGRSAGMAGITMAEDEDEHAACGIRSPAAAASASIAGMASNVPPTVLVSPSGDQSLDAHLLNLFFEYMHYQLPILQRSEFHKAYNGGRVPSLLVSAMCAAASAFLNQSESERKTIYDTCSQKVREQFHDACFEPSLEVVQTALIMTLCEYRHGSLHRAWVYLSMGFRLAIAMGYHHHDAKLRASPMQSTADIVHREACRRAFWGAFLLDRYTAIGGGKALGINDNDISVLLPLDDKVWQNHGVAPPLSTLEFFKPLGDAQPQSTCNSSTEGSNAHIKAALVTASAPQTSVPWQAAERGNSNASGRSDSSGISDFNSNASSPMTGVSSSSRNGTLGLSGAWNARADDLSKLGQFIKLMTVVGQVAQHINASKNTGGVVSSGAHIRGRPSKNYSTLDKALLQWKEELPAPLSYSDAKAGALAPEPTVFIACMHAIYHGAVIMLNRENMELLRGLPGQLDVSTIQAIRSLERCRIAAMEIVEIAHKIRSLPSAMTNALLPWALFQAGTLLIHFMISGSTPQAKEEARSAILSLDRALRDELSRYWNVSSKYHMVLSNMVKAWERTRQATPSQTTPRQLSGAYNTGIPSQQQPTSLHGQAQTGSAFGNSVAESYQALGAQHQHLTQMQMHMQLPVDMSASQQHQEVDPQSNQQSQSDGSFSTLLKPYGGPEATTSRDANGQANALSFSGFDLQANAAQISGIQNGTSNIGSMARNSSDMSNFMFNADTAQDSMNILQAFLSQLSQEQARQFSEGMQEYALHGPRRNDVAQTGLGATSCAGADGQSLLSQAPSQQVQHSVMLPNAALRHIQSVAAFDLAGQGNQPPGGRRDSLPISSSEDLFTSPRGPVFSSSAETSALKFGCTDSENMRSSELDPMLFNPMTPLLQELQLFNGSSLHAAPVSGGVHTSGAASSTISKNNARSSG
ncbi:hypothetical protein H4R24_001853 [Coemansia sp. RSA 988]|nr:hypothetical protein H4R24_001853 [Coemansia sp. RSA 988]